MGLQDQVPSKPGRARTHTVGQAEVPRQQDAPDKVSATHPSPLATPRVSPQPSSALVASLPTWASTARRWGPCRPPSPPSVPTAPASPLGRHGGGGLADIPAVGTRGEVALPGVPPHGAWAGAPGRAHLVLGGGGERAPALGAQQPEMSPCGGRPAQAACERRRGLALRSGAASREFSGAAVFTFCLLGWVGLFLWCFFSVCLFFFAFFFFLLVSLLCMCVCSVFSARLGVGGVFSLALTFH